MSLQLDARQRAMLAEMGVDWPLSAAQHAAAVAEREPQSAPATAAHGQPPAQPAAGVAPARRAAAKTPAAAPVKAPPPAKPGRQPGAKPALEPLPEGIERMDWAELEAAVATCRACGLCAGRTQTVFGIGSHRAEWMVVGEAPGQNEDRLGQPFVGQAGKLLDQMLAAIGLSRCAELEAGAAEPLGTPPAKPGARGVYIANVVKCRPPGNRNPEPDEVSTCEHYLKRQVALLQPKIILAMGRFAVQSLLQTTEPIGRLRGRVHRYHGVPVVVTYHPAYLLRALPEKAKAWQDLCLAQATFAALPKTPSAPEEHEAP